MYKKPLRIETTASAGCVLTAEELKAGIEAEKNGAMFSYQREVPIYLHKLSKEAETAGRLACERSNSECKLACAAVSLIDTITPESLADGDFTARCITSSCSGSGPKSAADYVQARTNAATE